MLYFLFLQHNTTGAHCEHCLMGHYGNPSLGGGDDNVGDGGQGQCRPCACPSLARQRSPSCSLARLELDGAAAVAHPDLEFVCTACARGYDGPRCEVCLQSAYLAI